MSICSSICPSSERTEDQLRANSGLDAIKAGRAVRPGPAFRGPRGGVGAEEIHKSCRTAVSCAKCQVRVPPSNTRSGRQGLEVKQGRIHRGGAPGAGLWKVGQVLMIGSGREKKTL